MGEVLIQGQQYKVLRVLYLLNGRRVAFVNNERPHYIVDDEPLFGSDRLGPGEKEAYHTNNQQMTRL